LVLCSTYLPFPHFPDDHLSQDLCCLFPSSGQLSNRTEAEDYFRTIYWSKSGMQLHLAEDNS
jgi:hypothetical protein